MEGESNEELVYRARRMIDEHGLLQRTLRQHLQQLDETMERIEQEM